MSSASSAPDLSVTHAFLERGPVRLFVRRGWEAALPVEALLGGAPLERWGEPLEHDLHGRGAVHLLGTSHGEIVAKRMSRGGLVGGMFRESYADPWRPAREAALAEALLVRDCRTPPIVVVRATRRAGRTWRLELATERVVGGRDLLDVLLEAYAEGREPGALAERLGTSLAGLHAAGLDHRDLQVKNLLVPPDEGALVVLDLDGCELREVLGTERRAAGLLRMLRSLAKHGLLPRRGARPRGDFAAVLLEGVAGAYPVGEVLGWSGAELARRLRRELRLREWCWEAARLG